MKKTTDICYNLSRRKRVRVVEGARLERVYTAMYRRFESSRFRQEVKRPERVFFYFFEEETRVRAQGSHGAKRHPLILSLPEGMKKRPARVFFYFFEEETRVRAQGSHGAIATKKDTTEVVPFLNNIFTQP